METTKPTKKFNSNAIIGVLAFSAFLAVFNETILNVALSPLMTEMNVTAGTVQWIITAYMIVVSVMVPITAFLIQTFETKHLFLGAMTLLLVGTICAACSSSFAMLLISRMLQASGTGMMIPLLMNTVLLVTPPEKHGAAMGICGCVISIGPALGPTVSGILLQFFSWHALFIMLIPLILIAMILGSIYLVNVSTLTKPKIDFISIILSSVGIGGVIYGISSFSGDGNMKIISLIFIVGIISLIIFVKRQLSLKEPMLEMRIFKYPIFSVGVVLVMLTMMTMFTMNVMLPMFLQGALKTTTFVAAMVLLPASLACGIVTPIGGKIYDKFGVKVLIPVGFTIILVALFVLSRSNSNTSLIKIMVSYIVVCIGVGLTMSPCQTSSLNQLPKEAYPHGIAVMNTLQQISAALGSSLFIGIMSASQLKALNNSATEQIAVATGFQSSATVAVIFVLVGLCLSFALRFGNKNSCSTSDLSLENEKVSGL
ncbi:DHA2 family efflux MFS transporter permease subunit [Clostridium estertheticum]|uniref:DHA2 family efflux MFS transporter permease subunit n=1 Tax=Clostridium estertheticum TaxID=238834 RepID=UPI001CF1EEFB|nr:DHA2 family efflux MFS transporter permease subunit [Clostridium estertheticum]MCB2353825.1 DHA2 family efflux MFS transporter permease subunit [Clostridium estertheticum]WAG40476.1 DHA2 family efflux MFS transporter permease subunit [Clostridium estertheticum]